MAKNKVTRVVTMHLDAGAANPATVGKDLGPLGVNLMQFCNQYNELTSGSRGHVVPAVVTVYEDRTFDVRVKQPTTASLIRRVAGLNGGSPRPGHHSGGVVTTAQLRQVAAAKLPDLNTDDLDRAVRIVAGTARSMGLEIKD
jgi:large subunit ribosomal protein L11